MELLRRAKAIIMSHWWGLLPALVLLLAVSYVVVWQFFEPLNLLDDSSWLRNFFDSRMGVLLTATAFLALALALGLETAIRRHGEPSLVDVHLPLNRPGTMVGSYPYSQHPDFFQKVETLIGDSSQITMIAIGLNVMWQKHLLEKVIERARKPGVKVTMCIANPYSPLVQERWIEEMQGIEPQFGLFGSRHAVEDMVARLDGEPVELKLFSNYPTFAVLVFDDDVFVYPYAYKLIGNFSPIFHFQRQGDSREVEFFMEHAQRVVADASPARDIVLPRQKTEYFNPDWIGLAVYAIPAETDVLYELGSTLLGYNVWGSNRLPRGPFADLTAQVGPAEYFGFHLTIADAMYFANESDVVRYRAVLRALAAEYSEFFLSNFSLTDLFRDSDNLVLRCSDTSGTLEAIHTELVHRMYRFAPSSTYRSGRSHNPLPRDPAERSRASLFIRHYGSPYILSSYIPHFTLLSELDRDSDIRKRSLKVVGDALNGVIDDHVMPIDSLCLMVKRRDDQYWRILDSVPLRERV